MNRRTADSRTGSRWSRAAALGLLVVTGALVGCSDDDDKDTIVDPVISRGACADCHADQDRLMALAIPDDPGDDPPGEG